MERAELGGGDGVGLADLGDVGVVAGLEESGRGHFFLLWVSGLRFGDMR